MKIKLTKLKTLFVTAILFFSISGFANAQINENISVIFEKTPLFKDAPIAPGYKAQRRVTIVNKSTATKKIQFRVRVDSEISSSDMLKLTNIDVMENETKLASDKLSSVDGKEIFLVDIAQLSTKSFLVGLELDRNADNDIQGKSIKFDIDFGFAGEPLESPVPEETPTTTPTPTTTTTGGGGGGGGGALTFSNLIDTSSNNTATNGPGNTNGVGQSNNNVQDSNESGNSSIENLTNTIRQIAGNLGIVSGGGALTDNTGGSLASISQEALASISANEEQGIDNQSLLGALGIQGFDDVVIPFSLLLILFIIIILLKRRKNKEGN